MPNAIHVSSLDELYSALSDAKGGETILLESGDYGDMSLSKRNGFDVDFPSNVTIASKDPNDPAVFSSINFKGVSNLTFDGVLFDYNFEAGDPHYIKPFRVTDSENITIKNSTFDGDVAQGVSEISDGFGYGSGLCLQRSTNVTVENNEFFNFHRGLVAGELTNVRVAGNDIHSLRSDGMNFSAITGAVIEDNHIHDFKASPNSLDHRDMIQFWTNATTIPNTDIIIRDNYLDIGDGHWTQSIFMRNEEVDTGRAGQEMYYRDILIENNVIINAHRHGITVGEAVGLTIAHNSVLHADGIADDGADRKVEIPMIRTNGNSRDVEIVNNVTSGISGHRGQNDWKVAQNAFVQDQYSDKAGYYSDVFDVSTLQPVDGVHDYRATAGGLLDVLNAGAAPTLSNIATPGVVTGTPRDPRIPENPVKQPVVDNGNTDNETPTGSKTPTGNKVPTDEKTPTDNKVPTVEKAPTDIKTPAVTNRIELSETGASALIAREHLEKILGQESFSISMNLTAQAADSFGEIMRLNGSFIVKVNQEGDLLLHTFTNEGRVQMIANGVNLTDGKSHDVNISLNDGMLSVAVDGKVLSSAPMPAPLADKGVNDLMIGNPWNSYNFDGVLSDLKIAGASGSFTDLGSAIEPSTMGPAPDIMRMPTKSPVSVPLPAPVIEPMPPEPETAKDQLIAAWEAERERIYEEYMEHFQDYFQGLGDGFFA